MPGRNDVTDGSGGEKFHGKPATVSNDPTSSRQRNPPRCHEARRINERAMSWFCQDGAESHEAKPISQPRPNNLERCLRIGTVREDGQRPRKPGGPECTRRNATARNDSVIHQAARSIKMPRSERQRQAQRINKTRSAARQQSRIKSARPTKFGRTPHASESHALKAPSSAPHQVATKRNPTRCQYALAIQRCPPRTPAFERHSP
jgi:hypothetical protein